MPILKRPVGSFSPPKQYSQKSRKGKRAWRKNIDSTEIQNGLEELREELIQGGVITEKKSEDLFTIDKHGDVSIPKKLNIKVSKALKATEIISQRSSLPAVTIRKRSSEKTSNGIIEPKRQRTSYVSHKEVTRLKSIAAGHPTKQVLNINEANYDVWNASSDEDTTHLSPQFSFLEKQKKKNAPKTLKKTPISLSASGKKVPAVGKPTGAYSYNPSAIEYTERLQALGQREVEAEENRLRAAEAERMLLAAAAKSAAEAEIIEARADLSEWEEDSAWEGFESGIEDNKLTAKRPERKTQAQRNKIKRRKEEERKAKMEYAIKKKNEQVAQAIKLAKELDKKKKNQELEVVSSDDSLSDSFETRRRKLGNIKLPEKNLEIVLPDELQDSLRLLKPEGNLLKERYRSLLERGKVECRKPISFARKPKQKVTEKWTHKDFVLH
ncbi:Ribosome biogenesis protein NOP53 [Erysiphe neolycopersici]|uniref:Ribosome biogenesis protein NOP53 n=1 Tax=Erysiphe neolycopersici TaxID=212602 RepID=A0A420I5I6_9PEZI|nr:Ribosome biogenesis protein NOP53 [Erysiphe neolycopersici]